jgi:transposase
MPTPDLPIVHAHAAGIDLGSTELFVSIDGHSVKQFPTFTASYRALVDHLQAHGVTTVVVEATGVYWVALYQTLEEAGIEVYLVNGAHARNLPGRKSDVQDCQWLQQLHSYGLLRKSFVPPETFRQLRTYTRLREEYIGLAAQHIQHMQKALDQMNIKVHHVISQLAGVSGMRMVRAIVAGERNAEVLLGLCEKRVQERKREALLAALEGTYRADHLFALGKAVECYDFYHGQITSCEAEIARLLDETTRQLPPPEVPSAPKPSRHHAPDIPDLHEALMRLTAGRNPAEITGMSDTTLMKLVGELGTNMDQWPTAKHFVSWLGLAPKTAQSGAKKRRVRQHVSTRAGQIFRQAGMSLINSTDSALGACYRRLKSRRGPAVAMKAVARKLAILYYNTLRYGTAYVEVGVARYEQQQQEALVRTVARLAQKINMALVPLT